MCTNVDISKMKTCISQDSRFPLFPLTIPETPESETKHQCSKQPFSEGPCSPVSRSPRSRGFMYKTKLLSSSSLQPQNSTSPKSGDTLKAENGNGHFGSVKRLMLGLETHQKAKRPRTGKFQKSSKQESSSEEEDLNKCLQLIRENADLKDEKSIKGFSKNDEKKSGKAERTLSCKILGNMTSEKRNSATGSITKLLTASHQKISFSEDEKENVSHITEPSKDLTEISSDNQSDLMVSYTSWVCNSDGGEKKENVLICVNKKESTEIKNLGDEKAITPAEDDFSILDDSWFDDQMEQSFEKSEHTKSKFEYVNAYFCLYSQSKILTCALSWWIMC